MDSRFLSSKRIATYNIILEKHHCSYLIFSLFFSSIHNEVLQHPITGIPMQQLEDGIRIRLLNFDQMQQIFLLTLGGNLTTARALHFAKANFPIISSATDALISTSFKCSKPSQAPSLILGNILPSSQFRNILWYLLNLPSCRRIRGSPGQQ